MIRYILLFTSIVSMFSAYGRKPPRPVPAPGHPGSPMTAHQTLHVNPREFGEMISAYGELVDSEHGLICLINFNPNYTNDPKYPNDLRPFLERALDKIGPPVSYRSLYPSVIYANSGAAVGLGQTLMTGQLPPGTDVKRQNGENLPPAALLITASLLRASDIVEKETANKLSLMIFKADLIAEKKKKLILKSVTVQVTVSKPSGQSLPGATSTFKIYVAEDENSRSLGAFWEGNGLGFDRRLVTTQDMGEALNEVCSAAMVSALSAALQIPAYRLGGPFTPDPVLDENFRMTLMKSGDQDLVDRARWLSWVGDPAGKPYSSYSAENVFEAMRCQKLDPNNREHLESFVFDAWKKLDYKSAAPRARQFLATINRPQPPPPPPPAAPQPPPFRPETFGWEPTEFGPGGYRFLVMDVSRFANAADRQSFEQIARKSDGVIDAKSVMEGKVVGIKLRPLPPGPLDTSNRYMDEAVLQYQMQKSNLDPIPVWADDSSRLLVLRPRPPVPST